MSLAEEREAIEAAIQSADASPDLRGSLVTGWVVIAEWTDTNGKQWLSRLDSGSGMTDWKREGMLRFGINDDWTPEETDG